MKETQYSHFYIVWKMRNSYLKYFNMFVIGKYTECSAYFRELQSKAKYGRLKSATIFNNLITSYNQNLIFFYKLGYTDLHDLTPMLYFTIHSLQGAREAIQQNAVKTNIFSV